MVLVGIEYVCTGPAIQRFDHVKQRILRQFVIVIQKRHEFSGGHRQGGVGGARNPAILRQMDHLDAAIGSRMAIQNGIHFRGLRAIVGHTKLPVRIALVPHRADGFFQDGAVRAICRRQDADARPVREGP